MDNEVFQSEMLLLMRELISEVKLLRSDAEAVKPKRTDEERAALAFVAIQKGATTLTKIANELGISRRTAARNPGICRTLETMVVDRKVSKAQGDDFRCNQ